ncbi:bifunctional nicotinamidase/pyrazinamidase [Cetobacterium sp.]|uniref:bifunctional nicotinamidase/pyrazinamidase n=2 Tax=Cetobacterium sp. TaxID=2071632 RepID=UPI003F355EAC
MKALIVVDIQNDFCDGGSLAVKNASEIIPITNKIIQFFNKNNLLIVGTKDWHPDNHKSFAINSGGEIGEVGLLNHLPQVWWPKHCVQNSFGAEFHPELLEIKNIIYKGTDPEIDSYSGFFDNGKLKKTELFDILTKHNITELFILGLATDYCVKHTVLDALDLKFKVNVISDACKAVNLSPDDSTLALNEMKQKGAYIIQSEDLI